MARRYFSKFCAPAGWPAFNQSSSSMTSRTSHILIVLSAFCAGLVVFLGVFLYATGQFSGASTRGSAVGGPFTLTDQNGQPITDADLKGKPFLVFFGYTHCPDVCPTTL